MTHRQAFTAAVARLSAGTHPTETPELDARVLLSHSAGLDHAGLLARWPDEMTREVEKRFEEAIARRLSGEPVAWITGFKEFCGMDFEVVSGLLVPRPDTETLVEAALEILGSAPKGVRVADVCTGTGCVAVSIAASAAVEMWACDISALSVEIAGRNVARLLPEERSVTVVESDLLATLPGPWDLIVSNPPYLTPAETLERVLDGGWREPASALDGGGPDGLDLPRRLIGQASTRLAPGGWLLLEAAGSQMPTLSQFLVAHGFANIRSWKDLAGIERVIGGRKD